MKTGKCKIIALAILGTIMVTPILVIIIVGGIMIMSNPSNYSRFVIIVNQNITVTTALIIMALVGACLVGYTDSRLYRCQDKSK